MNQAVDRQGPPAPRFTDKQGQYLAFIWAYLQINGRAPAERDLQSYFQVSPPSVHQMLIALQAASLIRKTPGQARSIELCVDPRALPVLGLPKLVKSPVQSY